MEGDQRSWWRSRRRRRHLPLHHRSLRWPLRRAFSGGTHGLTPPSLRSRPGANLGRWIDVVRALGRSFVGRRFLGDASSAGASAASGSAALLRRRSLFGRSFRDWLFRRRRAGACSAASSATASASAVGSAVAASASSATTASASSCAGASSFGAAAASAASCSRFARSSIRSLAFSPGSAFFGLLRAGRSLMPAASRKRSTRSDGWAPTLSQCEMRSASSFTRSGESFASSGL